MTILSIAASGIIAATAALFASSVAAPRNAASAEPPAPSPHRRADQRGITLQTLIVMAVLVLIAAGVSVVLIGITRGANDRLEDSGKTSNEANCEPWEIYDPEYASSGLGSPTGKGGVWSSGTGCIRVCYARFHIGQRNPADNPADKILSYEDEATRSTNQTKTIASLEFSRPERITNPQGVPGHADVIAPILNTGILVINGSQTLEYYRGPDHRGPRALAHIIPSEHISFTHVIADSSQADDPIPIGDLEIRVANDLRSCVLWDPANSKEIFRSQGTI